MAITYTTNLDLKNNRITNLGAPAVSTDAVTKQYVDNVATGLIWKDAVRVAASGNVSISSPGTSIDGVTLAAGNRVLLMGQTNNVQNGIYTYTGTALTRATDADDDNGNAELRPGTAVTVSEGATNGNKTFVLVTDGPITVGTTGLDWSLLNAGTSPVYTAGDGVDITNHVVKAVTVNGGGLNVAPSGLSVVADGNGGLEVRPAGIAAKLPVTNPGLAADNNGLRFLPRPNRGLEVDNTGVGVALKSNSGLDVDATGVRTVLAPDKGLIVDATGIQVKPGNGIATDSTGVKAVADNAGGLQVGSAGIGVKLDTPSALQTTGNGLAVVADLNGGLTVTGTGLVVKPKAGTSGLTVDNTGVSVHLRTDDGLDVAADGIGITTDNAGGLKTSNTGLGIKLRPDDGLDLDTDGVGIKTDNNGGLATGPLGLKTVANPAVTSDPANPASLIVGAAGVSVNTAVVARRFAASIGDGTSTSITVTHNLGTRDVHVELYSTAAPYDTVYAEVQRTDLNTVTVLFGSGPGSVPTNGQYRCVIVG